MAGQHDPDLAEALRRSLDQTNLQESQLADALAASVRTHHHEVARDIHQDNLSQIEEDLMTHTASNNQYLIKDLEADLLSSPTVVHATTEQWHTVGDRDKHRPRYVPLNLRRKSSKILSQNSSQPGINIAISNIPSKPPEPVSYTNAHRAPASHQRIPYRPPNLHSSINSPHAMHDTTQTTTSPKPTDYAVIPSDSKATSIPQPHPRSARNTSEPLVVIDGQNVGCSYGAGGVSRFRARGVEIVLDFYFNKGIPAVVVLPRHKVDTRSNIVNDRVADDPDLLNKLEDQGRLAFTPAGVHDDHFLLSYAMNNDIDLISNDRFQKEIAEQETQRDARKLRDFLKVHLIPYTFIHGEFVPNPKLSQLGRSIHHSRART